MECRGITECKWGEFLMADYLVTDTELTSVANAIRTKGGTSANLSFPTEFVSAINAIETGGGGLEYETGEVTYTSNRSISSSLTKIKFSESHSDYPFYACIVDATDTADSTMDGILVWEMFCPFKSLGATPIFSVNSNALLYGVAFDFYRKTGGTFDYTCTTFPSEDAIANYLTPTGFKGTGSGKYIANRTYKWIAIWK